ncbi:hypothetical protein XPA_006556 [Xanthoria parietina]
MPGEISFKMSSRCDLSFLIPSSSFTTHPPPISSPPPTPPSLLKTSRRVISLGETPHFFHQLHYWSCSLASYLIPLRHLYQFHPFIPSALPSLDPGHFCKSFLH